MGHLSPEQRKKILFNAFLTRKVEEALLSLYGTGKLNGTIHTCIGQEFSGAVLMPLLENGDSVFSNHRGHGHFLSYSEDAFGLIAEVMGRADGVCGGLGGSQHLCRDDFYSNGIQGGIVPVAAGLALARKKLENGKIALVFLGDGTLGEGVVYETMNLAAKWELPLLFVLEDNGWAQSTSKKETLAGDILSRPRAFGINSWQGNTWEWESLHQVAEEAIGTVRNQMKPGFLLIETFRLKAHSKGDDTRSRSEIEPYEKTDPINVLTINPTSEICALMSEVELKVSFSVKRAEESPVTKANKGTGVSVNAIAWTPHSPRKRRFVTAINEAFVEIMGENEKVLFLGEDVESPYGGAFKVSQGLSDRFPGRVMNTPISEGTIIGLGTGLSFEGFRPFVEIMFGDFLTLGADALINSAAKFSLMFNGQVTPNVVVRAPMGGHRGYGPTHSQTLDRLFMGVPGLRVLAITALMEPGVVYKNLIRNPCGPTLLLENKLSYGAFLQETLPRGFQLLCSDEIYPTVWIRPNAREVDVTLVAYGGMATQLGEVCERLFLDHDLIVQAICPTQIYPFRVENYLDILQQGSVLVTAEEGQGFGAFGSEVLSQLAEIGLLKNRKIKRIMPKPWIIPASFEAEKETLPTTDSIVREIAELF